MKLDDPVKNTELAVLELQHLRAKAESKEKEAEVLELHARGDVRLKVEARAKRAEAREYRAELRRRSGAEDFMRGMGFA